MTRRVQSLTEIVGLDPETNELITNSVYSWNPADDTFLYSGHSYIYEHVALMKNLSMKEMEREVRNRVELLDYMVAKDAQATRQKPYTHRDVGQLVAYYYKEPQKALAEARAELQRMKAAPNPTGARA
jgi:flagellar protein FlaI